MSKLDLLTLGTLEDNLKLVRKNSKNREDAKESLEYLLKNDGYSPSILIGAYLIIMSIHGYDKEIFGKNGKVFSDLKDNDKLVKSLERFKFTELKDLAIDSLNKYESTLRDNKWLIDAEVIDTIYSAKTLLQSSVVADTIDNSTIIPVLTCIEKIKGERNRIIAYKLQEDNGNVHVASIGALRVLLSNHTIDVDNLQLKSGKIINK